MEQHPSNIIDVTALATAINCDGRTFGISKSRNLSCGAPADYDADQVAKWVYDSIGLDAGGVFSGEEARRFALVVYSVSGWEAFHAVWWDEGTRYQPGMPDLLRRDHKTWQSPCNRFRAALVLMDADDLTAPVKGHGAILVPAYGASLAGWRLIRERSVWASGQELATHFARTGLWPTSEEAWDTALSPQQQVVRLLADARLVLRFEADDLADIESAERHNGPLDGERIALGLKILEAHELLAAAAQQ